MQYAAPFHCLWSPSSAQWWPYDCTFVCLELCAPCDATPWRRGMCIRLIFGVNFIWATRAVSWRASLYSESTYSKRQYAIISETLLRNLEKETSLTTDLNSLGNESMLVLMQNMLVQLYPASKCHSCSMSLAHRLTWLIRLQWQQRYSSYHPLLHFTQD